MSAERRKVIATWQRRSAVAIAVVVVPLAVLCGRMLYGARAELQKASAAKQPRERVRQLRRAMAYYIPGNPYVASAKERMRSEVRKAKRRGDLELALYVCHELRSALLRLRGLYQPYSDDLPAINAQIVELSVKQPEVALSLKTPAGQQRLGQRLANPREPSAGWTAIGLLGFVIWTVGGIALLIGALRPDGGVLPGRFWPGVGVIACGLLLYFAGMAVA